MAPAGLRNKFLEEKAEELKNIYHKKYLCHFYANQNGVIISQVDHRILIDNSKFCKPVSVLFSSFTRNAFHFIKRQNYHRRIFLYSSFLLIKPSEVQYKLSISFC